MHSVYGVALHLLRTYLRLRRRFARLLPAGIGEIIGLFEHLNFLNLIPTFSAILCAPDHVFLRLNRFTKGGFLTFPTPAQSLVQTATLIAALHFGGHLRVSESIAGVYIIVIALTSPFWSYALFLFANVLMTSPVASLGQYAAPFLIRDLLDEWLGWFWVPHAAAIITRPNAFRNMDWIKYFQASMLIAVYTCIALPIALFPAFTLFAILRVISVPAFGMRDIGGNQLSLRGQYMIFIVLAILVAYGVAWMILRPIAYAFIYCSKNQDEHTLRYELVRVRQICEHLLFRDGVDIRGAIPKSGLSRLKKEFEVLFARWKMQEMRAHRQSQQKLDELLQQRKLLSEDLYLYRSCFSDDCDRAVIESIDKLLAGIPLSTLR